MTKYVSRVECLLCTTIMLALLLTKTERGHDMIKQKAAQLHGTLINVGIVANKIHQCGRQWEGEGHARKCWELEPAPSAICATTAKETSAKIQNNEVFKCHWWSYCVSNNNWLSDDSSKLSDDSGKIFWWYGHQTIIFDDQHPASLVLSIRATKGGQKWKFSCVSSSILCNIYEDMLQKVWRRVCRMIVQMTTELDQIEEAKW